MSEVGPVRRYLVWLIVLLQVSQQAPFTFLPVEPRPWWVRWPVGLWAVLWFRRDPRIWLDHAEYLGGLQAQTQTQDVGRDVMCRVLRDYAEVAEPGILRRVWQEREDARREAEREWRLPGVDVQAEEVPQEGGEG